MRYPIQYIRADQHLVLLYLYKLRLIQTKGIWYRGDISLLNSHKLVSMAGTREPTDHGVYTAKKIASYLADHDYTIFSGLCKGCDIASHLGALEVKGGKTIAFVGNSLEDDRFGDRNYNSLDVAYQILEAGGLILSMVQSGDGNGPRWFARNRILAYLGLLSILVQTAMHGGTMNEFRYAQEAGKRVLLPDPAKEEYILPKLEAYRKYIGKNHEKRFDPDLEKRLMRFNGTHMPLVLEMLKLAEIELLEDMRRVLLG